MPAKKDDTSQAVPEPVYTPEIGIPESDSTPVPTAADLQGAQGASMFAALMDRLVEKLTASQLTPGTLKEILSSVGESNAELARKARWPENAEHPGISAYSYPEGDVARPKPTLSRKTFFCGFEEHMDRLTPAEIDAFNAITEPRVVRGGQWRAEIKMSTAMGGKPELLVWVPKDTVDQRMVLPSLLLILHELNGGQSTEDIMSLLGKIEGLKALLAAKGATAQELEAALIG